MSDPHRPRQQAVLSILEETGVITHAAQTAGVCRKTVHDYMEADREFYEKTREALDTADGMLQAELMRRALQGVQQPVYYKREVVGEITRKSDAVLMFASRICGSGEAIWRQPKTLAHLPPGWALRPWIPAGRTAVRRRKDNPRCLVS